MDKKIKKKLEKANQKVQKLLQQLAGAKQQDDEPGEVVRLEQEIADTRTEITQLRAS
jgi:peptidoglycan hydrolase CwlO-like protein